MLSAYSSAAEADAYLTPRFNHPGLAMFAPAAGPCPSRVTPLWADVRWTDVMVEMPSTRRSSEGVGAMLLAHAVSLARQDHQGPIRLESRLNARSFYAHGFVEIERSAVRRGHVDIPVVVMELPG